MPAFSQLPPSSSYASPFSRASRFQTPRKSQKEDISTYFEDVGQDASNSKLQVFTPFAVSGVDAIDEEDVEPTNTYRVRQVRHDIDSDSDSDSNRDIDVAFGGGEALHHGIDTPLPKRRKLSERHQSSEEPLLMSSSPAGPVAIESDAHEMTDEYSDLDDHDTSPSREARTHQPTSRFKMKTSAPPFLTNVEQKPVFRPPDSVSHLATEITTVLPEAFTPSRKKGKKDYVPGGLADTIRNTVLGIATEAGRKAGLDERLIHVENASLEYSGRAILAIDSQNVQWILPSQHDRGRPEGLIEKLEKIQTSGLVVISGNATNWALPLGEADVGRDVRFAAHWNVTGDQ